MPKSFAGLLAALVTLLGFNAPHGSAQDAANSAQTPPRTFTKLVIADVPSVLGCRLEELTARVGVRSGLDIRPCWWRLNMMAMESSTPFVAQTIADALGFVIVSDAGEQLIVAARETPEATQAEARLFLMNLFGDCDRPRLMWNTITASPRRTSSSSKPGAGKDGGAKEESFLLAGALSDAGVMNALGLREDDFKVAMTNYSLADFTLSHISDTRSSRYSSYSQNQPQYPNMAALVISARKCAFEPMPPAFDPWMPFPPGSMVAESGARFLQSLLSGDFRFRWSGFDPNRYRQRSVSRNPNEESDPFAVTMLLDDFEAVPDADPERLLGLHDRLCHLSEDAPERASTLLALRKEVECRLTPRGIHWADPTAAQIKQGAKTNGAQVRNSKRTLAERMAATLTSFASRSGVGAKYMEGQLSNWTLRQAYGMDDYNLFNLAPYSSSMLEIALDKEPYKGQVIFRTMSSVKQQTFAVRVDPQTGSINWLSGEPESEELVKARHEEMTQSMERLCQAALNAASVDQGFVPGREWVFTVLDGGDIKLRTTSSSDYDVRIALPGIARIVAEAGDIRLAALVDLDGQAMIWETSTKPDVVPPGTQGFAPGR